MNFCRKFFFCSILLLFFYSCSNNQNSLIQQEHDNTLKNIIKYKEHEITWVSPVDSILYEEPIEEEHLTPFEKILNSNQIKKIDKPVSDEVQKNLPKGLIEIPISERLFFNKNKPQSSSIYPEIEGFASLDTSLLLSEVKEIILLFIDSINNKQIDSSLLSKDSLYLIPSLRLQIDDIEIITDSVFGKPYIEQNQYLNEYQVPVRLLTKKGYYDAIFFMTNQTDKYLIEQVFLGSYTLE